MRAKPGYAPIYLFRYRFEVYLPLPQAAAEAEAVNGLEHLMNWAISEWPALAAARVALAPVVGLWTLVVTFWERAARWMNAPLCTLEVEEVSVGMQEAATSCAGLCEVTISG